jgi:leader peptidase (prepilin peptidase)/N-methyltransferase
MDTGLALSVAMVAISALACVYAWRRELNARWPIASLAGLVLVGLSMAFAAAGLPVLAAAALGSVITICGLICEVDRRHFIIPDILVGALLAVAVLAPFTSRGEQALGALITGGIFLAVRAGFQQLRGAHGLGLGDVKLAAAMGALLGPSPALLAIAVAAAATALVLAARRAAPALTPTPPNTPTAQNAAPFGIGLSAALAIALIVEAWR